MRSLFGSSNNPATTRGSEASRVNRHSSGWNELLKHLRAHDSLRILDIGPTSGSFTYNSRHHNKKRKRQILVLALSFTAL